MLDLFLREKLSVGEGEDRFCPKVPAYVRRSQFRLPNRAQVGKQIFHFYFQLLIPDTCDNDWAWNWVGSIQRVHPGLFAFHFRRIRGYCENLCIQERAWQKENGKTVGPTVLFFGCRNKDQDYIYRLVEATYCRESSYFFRLLLLLSCQGGAGGLGAGWAAHPPHRLQQRPGWWRFSREPPLP